ncbi:hypothetical protein OIU77_018036 [Salix suchowensis]|uniref:TFIIS central domain-containing protein n=1 Tax=Salix suchowensis TaxID=1278906 RepID=A0ABQ8ZQU4_9ROSI|nr:hypothetical protein OIU77_018036 [Salix suchowensis]
MEKQFLALFESAKKSADILATSASIFPEVYRCLDALDKLKRFPVTSSRVLVSTHVAKEVQYLTKHRVKMIRTAASCLLDTWARKLYARNSVIDEKKIEEEKENGFSCFKKAPQEPAKRCTEPGKVQGIRRCFKKPSTKRIPEQENVKDFCSFKKPSEEPVRCSDGLRGKVRHILVESFSRVAREVKEKLMEAVSLRDPISVAADVESVMFEKMGAFNGTKQLNYRSILFNMKDPKNPDLRRKVLLGQIKPEKLVTMTSEEMASSQRQFENEQIRKKSLCKEMKKAEQEHKLVDPMEY